MLLALFVFFIIVDVYYNLFIASDDPKEDNFYVKQSMGILIWIIAWKAGEQYFVKEIALFSNKNHWFIVFIIYALLLKLVSLNFRKSRNK